MEGKLQDVSEVMKSKKPNKSVCTNCGGTGKKEGKICPVCAGTGEILI